MRSLISQCLNHGQKGVWASSHRRKHSEQRRNCGKVLMKRACSLVREKLYSRECVGGSEDGTGCWGPQDCEGGMSVCSAYHHKAPHQGGLEMTEPHSSQFCRSLADEVPGEDALSGSITMPLWHECGTLHRTMYLKHGPQLSLCWMRMLNFLMGGEW